ncbi:MAG TPA: isoprenyl transferase [Actinomycetota bacterium]|nr:isoprenyl transferase [Actinomycetota bacterium]
MSLRPSELLYRYYEARLARELRGGPMPGHVGIILDGNRRWAAAMGYADAAEGHRRGAEKIAELLDWCEELRIGVVTIWLLSTENLRRSPEELRALLEIIEGTVDSLATAGRWRIRTLGSLEMLPDSTVDVLREAEARDPGGDGGILNVAVGYGGRQEIADAIAQMMESYAADGLSLDEAAKKVSPDEISRFLYTAGLPDPDLVIRTSGEVRMSGFLLWQSAHSEYYFCDPYWPAFRRIDFLRAVRAYQQRHRRFGR